MAPWIAMLAMSLAQKKQREQQEAQARQEARADISAQQAGSLGYPSYGVQAARFNRGMAQQNQGQNWMATLMPMLMGGGQNQNAGVAAGQAMPQEDGMDPWKR